MDTLEFYELAAQQERAARSYGVVTIIQTEGNVSRTEGRMLVLDDGSTIGTIGGGEKELKARADAMEFMQTGESGVVEYRHGFNPGECAGVVRVFIETHRHKPLIVVCGAGHVGGAILKAGRFAGFSTVLIDCRPDDVIADKIASADRFIHVEKFGEELENYKFPNDTYYAITTFGHEHDEEVLKCLVTRDFSYLGMLGSHRKAAAIKKHLYEAGCKKENVNALHCPMGLNIGGQLPEEIGIAVVAEMMAVKYGKSEHFLPPPKAGQKQEAAKEKTPCPENG